MKLLLVDDHQLFVEGLCSILQTIQPKFDISIVYNGQDAIAKLMKGNFDIALIDLRLPGIDGFKLLEELAKSSNLVPVVIITASEDPADIQHCLDLGALGFLSKSSSGKQVVSALNAVMNGEIVVSGLNNDRSKNWAYLHDITPRQLEVLRLMKHGKSNQIIAEQLSVSLATIKTHITAIFRSLVVKSRTEAIQKAQLLGLD